MKIAKFIYPMLLVALGLHGLALFVPIGGAPEPTPENVVVDDINVPEGAADDAVPGRLPVPDPNVSTGTAQAIRSANRSANRATVSRSAPNNSQPSAPASNPNSVSSESSNNASAAEIPVLPPNNTDSNRPNSSITNNAPANSETNNTVNNPATSAIATISEALKKFRDDLSQEITYNPEHTDLEGAADRRDQWLSSINQQASAATIETLEPTPALEVANLAYPINESKQPNRHSFKLCLDQPPHDAEVGILVDAQGKVARTPKIIRSTGYAALNNEILAAIAAYDNFPTERDSKAYTLIVKVEYSKDECVSLPKLMSSVPLL